MNPVITRQRDWRKYNKESLNEKLKIINWKIEDENVQDYWNNFENKLISVVDLLVPIRSITTIPLWGEIFKTLKT